MALHGKAVDLQGVDEDVAVKVDVHAPGTKFNWIRAALIKQCYYLRQDGKRRLVIVIESND